MKIIRLTAKISFAFLLLALLGFSFPCLTSADGTALKISPVLFRIEANPPADIWTPFIIENQSDQPVSLKIGYKAFDPQASKNGSVVFLKNGQAIQGQDKKIFEKMQIVDDQNISHDNVDLGPRQKKRFRLRILLPANEPTSDYYFSLLFLQSLQQTDQKNSQENIENQKSSLILQAGVGMNVLLAIGAKETPIGSIETFTAPRFSNTGPIPFTLSVHNSGMHFFTSQGNILIKNMFGQNVGKVIIPPSVILAGTSRTFVSANSSADEKYLWQNLIWPEQFLLGIYTATLTLTLSDKGPVYTRTIHFLGFPVILSGEILIVLATLGYIYLRVKRKVS